MCRYDGLRCDDVYPLILCVCVSLNICTYFIYWTCSVELACHGSEPCMMPCHSWKKTLTFFPQEDQEIKRTDGLLLFLILLLLMMMMGMRMVVQFLDQFFQEILHNSLSCSFKLPDESLARFVLCLFLLLF